MLSSRKGPFAMLRVLFKSKYVRNFSSKLHKDNKQGNSVTTQDEIFSYVNLLKTYANEKDLCKGKALHYDIEEKGLLQSPYVASALISLYVKCGSFLKARQVLGELRVRTVSSWNALIAGYAQLDQGKKALECFEQMKSDGICPNAITLLSVLKACGSTRDKGKGKEIHEEIFRNGLLHKHIMLGNALMDMYAKCGVLAKTQKVFDDLPVRNVVSWNALITGYTQHGRAYEALNCFEQMKMEVIFPNEFTLTSALKACGSIGAIDKGTQIHDDIVILGLLEKSSAVGNALVDMYSKCSALDKAQDVLDNLPVRNVIAWSALIAGYAHKGQGHEALECFDRMKREGFSPDAITFSCLLKACGSTGSVEKGEQIHDEIASRGFLEKNVILGTALVDMYAKCNQLEKAEEILNKLSSRNVVSWSALISGYIQKGQGPEALNCFEQMRREGITPDTVTITTILKACAMAGAIELGEQIHHEVVSKELLEKSVMLGGALVDMYAKLGFLEKARQVLSELPVRNVISWSALIAGYAKKGQSQKAVKCFEQMQSEGLSPDAVTILCLLNACSQSGLVDEAETYFSNMGGKYGMKPDVAHNTCMIDVFGCVGQFDKALSLIEEMKCSDYHPVWLAILSACRKWGNVKVARSAFDRAVQLEKNDAVQYVLMSSIYASAGMQKEAEKIQSMKAKLPVG